MISILLNGANGKMGRTLIELAEKSENFKIVAGIDRNIDENFSTIHGFPLYENFPKIEADAIIDFSNPSALDDILQFAENNKIPAVLATTGYSEFQIDKIKKAAEKIPIFFSFNMSIGINLLANLVKKSYQVLGEKFDIEIVEKHHNQKIDAPSGTALMLAQAINEEAKQKFMFSYNRHSANKAREKNEIGIHSIRGGTIVGEHEVIFAGEDETIALVHSAGSKKIFAVGALKAADFLKDKKPKLYNMEDLIKES